jgi:hypothetical protein
MFGFPQGATAFRPGGGDIRDIQGMSELALGRTSAEGDQIHLGPAGFPDVEEVRADGDLAPQQGSRLGSSLEAALHRRLFPFQRSVNRAGTEAQKQGLFFLGETIASLDPWKPQAKNGR